ncbi:MAG: SIMPL domain-containing protein [Candidatus Paceibacterota bacterium]|jgi:hypothetical protein
MEKSKSYLFYSLSALAVVTIILGVVALSPLERFGASLTPARTLSVSASGKASVVPDIASFSFSVVTEGKDVGIITNDNNTKVNGAIDAVVAMGVDKKDITTADYSLQPVYTQSQVGVYGGTFVPSIAKYSLTQTVSVKIRDFSKISPIMSALPGMGINRIGSLSFTIDDSDIYLATARADAYAKALVKAKTIASENGFALGGVVNISEYQNQPYPMYSGTAIGMGGVADKAVAPTIEPGSKEVTINVNVVYEIK